MKDKQNIPCQAKLANSLISNIPCQAMLWREKIKQIVIIKSD